MDLVKLGILKLGCGLVRNHQRCQVKNCCSLRVRVALLVLADTLSMAGLVKGHLCTSSVTSVTLVFPLVSH